MCVCVCVCVCVCACVRVCVRACVCVCSVHLDLASGLKDLTLCTNQNKRIRRATPTSNIKMDGSTSE